MANYLFISIFATGVFNSPSSYDKNSQLQIVVTLKLDNGTALLLSAGVAVSSPCRYRLQPGLRKSSQVICSTIFIGFHKGGRCKLIPLPEVVYTSFKFFGTKIHCQLYIFWRKYLFMAGCRFDCLLSVIVGIELLNV